MGGARGTLTAPTLKELKKQVKEWERKAESSGLSDIRSGWDENRVKQTEDGQYTIDVWAHS